jgi:sulfur carrier protein ThiS
VGDLLAGLAQAYPVLASKVFDPQTRRFNLYVVVLINDQAHPAGQVAERVLAEGDKITILPIYVGG